MKVNRIIFFICKDPNLLQECLFILFTRNAIAAISSTVIPWCLQCDALHLRCTQNTIICSISIDRQDSLHTEPVQKRILAFLGNRLQSGTAPYDILTYAMFPILCHVPTDISGVANPINYDCPRKLCRPKMQNS